MIKTVKLCVDGWCSGNPGKGGWKVKIQQRHNKKWKTIQRRDLKYTTNNIAEFFALIDALKWCRNYIDNKPMNNEKIVIFTDSRTAMSWYRKKRVRTTLKCDQTKDIVSKIERWLRKTDLSDIIVSKWDTKRLGEIPADFGRKKTSRKITKKHKRKIENQMKQSRKEQLQYVTGENLYNI